MSNKPYQIRTAYSDGAVTTDMINNENNNPRLSLELYLLSNSDDAFENVTSIEVLDWYNNVLDVCRFSEERQAA